MRIVFSFLSILFLLVSSHVHGISSAESEKNKSAVERLEKIIDKACETNQKIECSSKKCLTESNPVQCYQEVMATRTFEDRIQDHKSLCDGGSTYDCGLHCGMLEKKTDYCIALDKNTQTLTPDMHLKACQLGVLNSCSEYCTLTVKNPNSPSYGKEILACELHVRKKQ